MLGASVTKTYYCNVFMLLCFFLICEWNTSVYFVLILYGMIVKLSYMLFIIEVNSTVLNSSF